MTKIWYYVYENNLIDCIGQGNFGKAENIINIILCDILNCDEYSTRTAVFFK